MIGGLRGKLGRKTPGEILVDVGGVLYQVQLSLQAFAALPAEGEAVALDVVTEVREDAFVLFGFLDPREQMLFRWLRAVSGVGPKLALAVLSGLPVDETLGALAEGDLARLTRIPGLGRKTSERLVLELRDRAREGLAGVPTRSRSVAAGGGPGARDEEVLSALVNLGYKRIDAEKALRNVAPEVPLEEAIREVLRRFAR